MTKKQKVVETQDIREFGDAVKSAAEALDKSIDEFVCEMMYESKTLPIVGKGTVDDVMFIPGNTFDGHVGPDVNRSHDVVIVGKMPWTQERMRAQLCVGASGDLLREIFKNLGVDISNWYMTNVVRFMPPRRMKTLKAAWVKECAPLLDFELELIKPKFILLLGADAVKAIYGRSASLKKLRGADSLTYKGAKVMVSTHPAATLSSPEQRPALERDLAVFARLVQGVTPEQAKQDYGDIISDAEVTALIDSIIEYWNADPTSRRRLGIDAEWGGTNGADFTRGLLRTIQISHKERFSRCIVIRRQKLEIDDKCCTEAHVAAELTRLCAYPNVELGGHNFRGDLKWLDKIGADCNEAFNRGFDTMLAYHLLHPAEEGHALENLAVRYTDLGRYDLVVKTWLDENGYGDKGSLRKYGYAPVPDEMLHPYACADTDVVIRSWPLLEAQLQREKLSKPYSLFGQARVETLLDLYRNIIHPCNIPLHEIESIGMLADENRLKRLTELFATKRDEMLKAFQKKIKWPTFNFRSVDQVREFLFGNSFGKEPVKPAMALTAGCQPIKTTGKPSQDWSRVSIEDIESGHVNPSTDSETLLILSTESPLVRPLQELRFVDQIIKNFLRPPSKDEETDQVIWDGGLVREIDFDGRIRTSLSQMTDTGRYRSSTPNLQNLPKKQESELRKIFSPNVDQLMQTRGWGGMSEKGLKELGLLHPEYYTLRSCFKASPGRVLIEADYAQAELNVMAHLANDQAMMEIMADRERDLHSEMAVTAFQLNCEPNEVKKLYPKYRIMANFAVLS